MLTYTYKIADSIGGRNEQQDFAGATETKFGLLVVVCDGMGGAKGGATASRMAVTIVMQNITNQHFSSPATALLESINKANTEIFNRSRADENVKGMGTTITAILLQKEKATVAHVGDSRVYQFKNPDLFGKSVKKVFRTNDHSKVFELVKRGILNEEQARVSDEANIILRALGLKAEVDVEINDRIPYLKGNLFLLCTDGVCGAVPESTLLELLSQKEKVDISADKLIATIDQIGYRKGGGHDNLTAALIECNTNSTLKSPINMNTKILMISLMLLLILSLGYIGYTKLSSNAISLKDFEALKQRNMQLEKKVDSFSSANKLFLDSLNQERIKLENIEMVLHPKSNRHTVPSDQTSGDPLLDNAGSILEGRNTTNKDKKSAIDSNQKRNNAKQEGNAAKKNNKDKPPIDTSQNKQNEH